MNEHRKFDLEERLINFACLILSLEEKLPKTYSANYLNNQLVRSGLSPALNYGEVQAAESRKDFIHKMSICLKELRETRTCLKIILKRNIVENQTEPANTLNECSELISIFAKSLDTSRKNSISETT